MAEKWIQKTSGIPDELFNQNDKVPGPTKEEIRVITISKLRLTEGATIIDIGCGTGGLTVEAALQVMPKGKVYAIDEDEEAIKLTTSNVEKFGVQSVVMAIHGKAPEALANVPKVDAIIVGGGSSQLKEVLCKSKSRLKTHGRVVINAILLETACNAVSELNKLGFLDIDVALVSIAKGKQINSGTMMMARNPITIISATRA